MLARDASSLLRKTALFYSWTHIGSWICAVRAVSAGASGRTLRLPSLALPCRRVPPREAPTARCACLANPEPSASSTMAMAALSRSRRGNVALALVLAQRHHDIHPQHVEDVQQLVEAQRGLTALAVGDEYGAAAGAGGG